MDNKNKKKQDGDKINLGQDYELNYMLKTKGFRETEENRAKLIDICNAEKNKTGKRTLKRENVKAVINHNKTLEKKR